MPKINVNPTQVRDLPCHPVITKLYLQVTKLPESHTMTPGMRLVFVSPKTGLDPGLYRVTHSQFPSKYLRILPTRNNELNLGGCALPRRPPTANIAVQPPVVSRPNVAVLQPGPAKHSYQVILDLLSSPVISTFQERN